tara:strand:- start:88 stop:1248 length:1161 start_codon:yes stop_codon:yes gene_type:complete
VKIKVDKNGIGDIRQLRLNPDNPYVRDEEQLSSLKSSFDKRVSKGLIPNITPIIVYADGLIKGGNSRYTAGMESKNYFCHIVVDPRKSTDLTEEELLDEVTDDNIKRKEMWTNIVGIFNKWVGIQMNKADSDKKPPVTVMSDYCKEKFGYTYDTVKLAVELEKEKPELFAKIDNEGWGVRKAWAEYQSENKLTAGRQTAKSTQSIDFIDKPIVSKIVSKVAMALNEAREISVPISNRTSMNPYDGLNTKVRSTIISTFMETIGSEVFIGEGVNCEPATAHFADADWYFPEKSLQCEIKVTEFEGVSKTSWKWNKIKGGWHTLVVHSDAKRFFVVHANLEESNFTKPKSSYDSCKVFLKDILSLEHQVMIGEVYEDKAGLQVNMVGM